jgi:hypothetical protein
VLVPLRYRYHDIGIALWFQQEVPECTIDIRFRHQVFGTQSNRYDKKWKSAEYELNKCFSHTREWNVSEANSAEISSTIKKEQGNDDYKRILTALTKGDPK